jgi:glutamate-ammonia-ligase adenylyltransferase
VKTGLRNGGIDIKNGEGGIRDIEFLVQGLQLVHGAEFPDIISGNTLDSLALLKSRNLIPAGTAEQVRGDYIFLRRVEHFLQLFEDRQVHTLPAGGDQLMILAKRMLGGRATREEFNDLIASCRARVREYYDTYLSQD